MLVYVFIRCCVMFVYKQKTAYDMRISDWSSDVFSSDLPIGMTLTTLAISSGLLFSISRYCGVTTAQGATVFTVMPFFVNSRASPVVKIGRASCRERVCQYV